MKASWTEAYKSIEIAMRCCSLVIFRRSRLWLDERRFSLVSFHRSRFLLADAFYVSFLRNIFFVRKSQYLWYKWKIFTQCKMAGSIPIRDFRLAEMQLPNKQNELD